MTHREDLSVVLAEYDRTTLGLWTAAALGLPLLSYLSGDHRGVFFVHVLLASLLFGSELLGRVVLEPTISSAAPEIQARYHSTLQFAVVLLVVGTVGSGLGLALLLGNLEAPSDWLWVTLIGATVLVVNTLWPLQRYSIAAAAELHRSDSATDRVERTLARTRLFGMLQVVVLIGMIGLMTGLRWGL